MHNYINCFLINNTFILQLLVQTGNEANGAQGMVQACSDMIGSSYLIFYRYILQKNLNHFIYINVNIGLI